MLFHRQLFAMMCVWITVTVTSEIPPRMGVL